MLTGGCHCGAVRYEVAGTPFHATICHCADCRRGAGAASVAWFTVRRDGLRLTGDAPRLYDSSPRAARGFCGRCGTSLTFEGRDHPDEIDLTTASLDDPAAVPPADHVWTASAVAWDRPGDGLPRHARSRDDGDGGEG